MSYRQIDLELSLQQSKIITHSLEQKTKQSLIMDFLEEPRPNSPIDSEM